MDTDLTGKLLIAAPKIGDPRFSRSVILVCAHTEEFAMGIVLNKPLEHLRLNELLDHLEIPTEIEVPGSMVLDGGPVSTDRGFVLHTEDCISEGATLPVTDGMCMTATRDMLETLGTADAPQRAVLALGYAGWGAGQLEIELSENAWIVGKSSVDLVFGEAHSQKWTQALEDIGVHSGHLQIDSGHA